MNNIFLKNKTQFGTDQLDHEEARIGEEEEPHILHNTEEVRLGQQIVQPSHPAQSINQALSCWKMRLRVKKKKKLARSVGDPDPVGSGPFCRIRIRKFFTGSGSRIRYSPLKVLIIIRKGDFFRTTFSVL
jgi:hypothetical protein